VETVREYRRLPYQVGYPGPEQRPESAADVMRYKAFISYSHADKRWAKRIHRSLERYRVPVRTVREARPDVGVVPKRLAPSFRDDDELPASADLGADITEALLSSEWLVVVCSPDAASW
jgi:hypothetical protein